MQRNLNFPCLLEFHLPLHCPGETLPKVSKNCRLLMFKLESGEPIDINLGGVLSGVSPGSPRSLSDPSFGERLKENELLTRPSLLGVLVDILSFGVKTPLSSKRLSSLLIGVSPCIGDIHDPGLSGVFSVGVDVLYFFVFLNCGGVCRSILIGDENSFSILASIALEILTPCLDFPLDFQDSIRGWFPSPMLTSFH